MENGFRGLLRESTPMMSANITKDYLLLELCLRMMRVRPVFLPYLPPAFMLKRAKKGVPGTSLTPFSFRQFETEGGRSHRTASR